MTYRRLNILLVDDDVLDIKHVERAFEEGHLTNPIWVAHDGVEALEMLRGDVYPRDRRLLLIDLEMPRMNGLELLREIRSDERLSALPVIVLTTSNDDRARVEAYGLQVAGYLVKPMSWPLFVEMMVSLQRFWGLVELP